MGVFFFMDLLPSVFFMYCAYMPLAHQDEISFTSLVRECHARRYYNQGFGLKVKITGFCIMSVFRGSTIKIYLIRHSGCCLGKCLAALLDEDFKKVMELQTMAMVRDFRVDPYLR